MQHGDVLVVFTGDRGHFEADESAADDDDVFDVTPVPLEALSVGEVAHVAHAVEVGTGHVEQAWASSGGEGQLVEGDFAAGVGHGHTVLGAPEHLNHLFVGDDDDLVVDVKLRGSQFE